MFDITTRSLPHFVLIWYLSSITKLDPNQISIIISSFSAMFLTFIWNNKNRPNKWYRELDFTYMTGWALLEMALALNHPEISMFLIISFVNQFIFFTNSVMDKSNDIPAWKYVLWNDMCFAKTLLVMTCLRKFPY